jgi:hypothetical protein
MPIRWVNKFRNFMGPKGSLSCLQNVPLDSVQYQFIRALRLRPRFTKIILTLISCTRLHFTLGLPH